MFGSRHGVLLIAVLTLCCTAAGAQESLDSGKTPIQLFASDCAICHKSAQGLAKGGGVFGLQNFLRAHYTASRESAAAIAAYLVAVDRAPPPAANRTRATKRTPKADDKAKSGDNKSGDKKTGDKKSGGSKSDEAKSSGPQSAEPKSSEPKSSDAKSSEPKSSEPRSSDAKSSEPKPSEPKPAQGDKPDKPD